MIGDIPFIRTAVITFIVTGVSLSLDALTDFVCNLRALGWIVPWN